MFDSARDALLKKVIQDNPVVKRLGTIHSLSLNTNERTCVLDIGLTGEPAPLRFTACYTIIPVNGGADFRFTDLHCEKAWIDEVIRIALEQRGGGVSFSLTGMAAKLGQLFL